MPVDTIAGTAYQDAGATPYGPGKTVSVSVNGAAAAVSVATLADGTYLTTGITVVAGDVLTVYLDDGDSTNRAVTVTVGTGNNLSGIDLWKNYLICRQDNGGSLANADLSTAAGNADPDVSGVYSVTAGALTVGGSGNVKHLAIASGQTFAPGGACTVWGSWANYGTHTAGGNVTLRAGSGGQTIRSGGSAFSGILSINTVTYTLADALSCAALTVVVGGGSLDTSNGNNYPVTCTGNLTNSGTLTLRNSVITASGQIPTMTCYDLVAAGAGTVKLTTGTLTVTHALTINGGATLTLNASSQTVVLTGATFTNAGTLAVRGNETLTNFTNDTANGGTVTFANASGAITGLITGYSYYNLTLANTSGTIKPTSAVAISGAFLITGSNVYDANGQTTTVTGLTTVNAAGVSSHYTASTATQTLNGGLTIIAGKFLGGSGDVDVNGNVTFSAGTLVAPSGAFTVGGNWMRSGAPTFTQGTGTVTLDGTSQTIGGSTTFYRLTKNVSSAATLTFTDGTTQTVQNALTLTGAAGQLLTLAGSASSGWTIAVPTTQSLSYLSVSRSTAAGNTAAAGATSTDGGNNTNWTFGTTTFDPGTVRATTGVLGTGVC